MKKIFLICLLIIATQFVFAGPTIWIKTDKNNINKKTVDLGAIYNSDKGKDTVDLGAIYNSDKGKDTVDLGAIYNSDKGKDTVNLNFRDISTDKPNNPVNDNQLRDFCYNNLDYSTDNTNNKPVNAAGIIFANYFNWFPTGIQDKDPIEAYAPIVLSISTFDTNSITGDIHRDNNSYYNFSTGMEGNNTVDLSQTMLGKVSASDNKNGEYVSTKEKNAEIEKQLKQILLYTPCNKKDKVSLIQKIENLFIKNRNF